jgi:hypothetical protein
MGCGSFRDPRSNLRRKSEVYTTLAANFQVIHAEALCLLTRLGLRVILLWLQNKAKAGEQQARRFAVELSNSSPSRNLRRKLKVYSFFANNHKSFP